MNYACIFCGTDLDDAATRLVVSLAAADEYPETWRTLADVCMACALSRRMVRFKRRDRAPVTTPSS